MTINFAANVDKSAGPDGCWPWMGRRDRAGYGHKGHTMAHRFGYELARGPIPAGLTLDHLCRNRACVNPAHLEPVTLAENILRGESPHAKLARATHCVNGHPFDDANTYRGDGSRGCRACNLAAVKRYKERKRAAA